MEYENIADVLKAMAHPVRLQILTMLRDGEKCVCSIESALGRRQAYISQQLMVLRETGIVKTRKEGLQVFYELSEPQILQLLEFLQDHLVVRETAAV